MKFTRQQEHEIEQLKEILGPERAEAIEEQVEIEKAAERYRELLERASDR